MTSGEVCDSCGKPPHSPKDKLLRCSRCQQAYYHDRTCQKKHFPKHKTVCRKLQQQQPQNGNTGADGSSNPTSTGCGSNGSNSTVASGALSDNELYASTPASSEAETSKPSSTFTSGFKVVDNDILGRIGIATQSFKPGDTVLLEIPAIAFDTTKEYYGLFNSFTKASKSKQKEIMDLYSLSEQEVTNDGIHSQRFQKLESQRQSYIRNLSISSERESQQANSVLTTSLVRKLLLIIETNAHQLFNGYNGSENNNDDNSNSKIDDATKDPSKQWMGLFLLGAMVEHSCNPNCSMNTTTDGKLEFIAETYIEKGEHISYSYIEGIYEKPRHARQALLLKDKLFLCKCTRCEGVDECRPLLIKTPPTTNLDTENKNNSHNNEERVLVWSQKDKAWLDIQSILLCLGDNDDSDTGNNSCDIICTNKNVLRYNDDDDIINDQKKIELELIKKVQAYENLLEQFQQSMNPNFKLYKNLLSDVINLVKSPLWIQCIHTVHCINVQAYQVISNAAGFLARIMIFNNDNKVDESSSCLLRLSAIALMRIIIWVEQNISLLRQKVESSSSLQQQQEQEHLEKLKNVSKHLSKQKADPFTITQDTHNNHHFGSSEEEVNSILQILFKSLSYKTSTSGDVALNVFYAGQELILAKNNYLALELYTKYNATFQNLKQPGYKNRKHIQTFIDSKGKMNPFDDILFL